jgi:hypothetical protein
MTLTQQPVRVYIIFSDGVNYIIENRSIKKNVNLEGSSNCAIFAERYGL